MRYRRLVPTSFFVLITFLSYQNAHALFADAYITATLGTHEFSENSSTSDSAHSGWNAGGGFGGRAGISFSMLNIGAVVDYSYQAPYTVRKNRAIGSVDTDYKFTYNRLLLGGHLGLDLGIFTIFGEYYPTVTGNVIWHEVRDANPFRQDSAIRGNGWALGWGFRASIFYFGAVYRKVWLTQMNMRGTQTDLPSAEYSVINTDEGAIQLGLTF